MKDESCHVWFELEPTVQAQVKRAISARPATWISVAEMLLAVVEIEVRDETSPKPRLLTKAEEEMVMLRVSTWKR